MSLKTLLFSLFIFFCFFPYLQVIPLPVDSQPYALILGVIIVILYGNYHLRWEFKMLAFVCAFSLIGLYEGVTFNALRSVVNYISIFVIPWATCIVLRQKRLSYSFWRITVLIWGIFGIIQLIGSSTFGGSLLYRAYNTASVQESGRGSTSLAPEATFYGIICLLQLIVGYLNFRFKPNYRLWMLFLACQLLLLSRSSMTIMVILLGFILYAIVIGLSKRPLLLISGGLAVAFIILCIHTFEPLLQEYRAGRHLIYLLDAPKDFITTDNSVNERFIHAFFPFIGFIQNYGLPHFYDKFDLFMRHIYFSWEWSDIISFYRMGYSRIMSGVGCAIFELGWVGLFIYIVLFRDIAILARNNFKYWLVGILLFFVLLNAMPLTNGLVGFVFGNIIYRRYFPLNK